MSFKAPLMKAWTITDDKITVGKKEIPLNSITKVEHTMIKGSTKNGVIQVFYGSGAFSFATLAYPWKQKDDGEKAAAYILGFVRGDDPDKSVAEREKIQQEGYRKRCTVCGHIFVYTDDDLRKNLNLAKSAKWSSISAIGGALGGSYASSATQSQTANDQMDRIVDYNRCPKCGSRNLVDATDEDIARLNQPQGTVVQQISAAEELKKFKELLDMGVITQEEFDAKKKQLLGL